MSRARRLEAHGRVDDSDDLHSPPPSDDIVDEPFSDEHDEDNSAPSDDEVPTDDEASLDDDEDSEPSDVEPEQSSKSQSALSQMRQIPFGALAEAQDSTSTRSRRKSATRKSTADPSPQLQAIKDRLADLRAAKGQSRGQYAPQDGRTKKHRQEQDDEPMTAQSKHAPMEQSSRRPVTRKRAVLPELSSNPTHARDPRFHASVSGHVNTDMIAKRYSFLSAYETAELERLRGALKTTKDPAERAELQRAINSKTNKLKSNTFKDKERELVRNFRKTERERVKQGKKPFFMKKTDIKKRAREELEGALTDKQRQHLEERREKKRGHKEKKAMPGARRRPLA